MWKLETYVASWRDSEDLLKGSTLKMLALVSLRALFSLYHALLNAWPLLLFAMLPILGQAIGFRYFSGSMIFHGELYTALIIFGLLLYYIALIGGARPSVDYKDPWYWLNQPLLLGWAIGYILFTMLIISFPPIFDWLFSFLINWPILIWLLLGGGNLGEPLTLVSLVDTLTHISALIFVLWLLFLFDAKKGLMAPFRSFKRAILMLIFNLPIFIFLFCLFKLLLVALVLAESYFLREVTSFRVIENTLFLGIVVPFWICCITTIYVKRLHEQFSLYYSK